MDNFEPGMPNDEWLRLQDQINSAGGVRMPSSTPQPSFDPNESWVELAPLKKVSLPASFDLVEQLRQLGIAVRGKSRLAGLFSGGKVNVTLSVPERFAAEAARIVAKFLFDQGIT